MHHSFFDILPNAQNRFWLIFSCKCDFPDLKEKSFICLKKNPKASLFLNEKLGWLSAEANFSLMLGYLVIAVIGLEHSGDRRVGLDRERHVQQPLAAHQHRARSSFHLHPRGSHHLHHRLHRLRRSPPWEHRSVGGLCHLFGHPAASWDDGWNPRLHFQRLGELLNVKRCFLAVALLYLPVTCCIKSFLPFSWAPFKQLVVKPCIPLPTTLSGWGIFSLLIRNLVWPKMLFSQLGVLLNPFVAQRNKYSRL